MKPPTVRPQSGAVDTVTSRPSTPEMVSPSDAATWSPTTATRTGGGGRVVGVAACSCVAVTSAEGGGRSRVTQAVAASRANAARSAVSGARRPLSR